MNFTVPDMSCGDCKAAIEAAVAAAGGQAQVDVAAKAVRVEGLDPAAARAAIEGAGYTVVAE